MSNDYPYQPFDLDLFLKVKPILSVFLSFVPSKLCFVTLGSLVLSALCLMNTDFVNCCGKWDTISETFYH